MNENNVNNQTSPSYYPDEMNFDAKTMSFSKKEIPNPEQQKTSTTSNMSSPFSNMNLNSLLSSMNNPDMLTKILGNNSNPLTSLLSSGLTNNSPKSTSTQQKEKSLNTKDSFEEI